VSIEFTTVLVLDKEHLPELKASWPTWVKHRPILQQNPLVVLCDTAQSRHFWLSELQFLPEDNLDIVPIPQVPEMSQRERMLSAFVHMAPFFVKTPWYLKLDTDAVAHSSDSEWPMAQWFQPNDQGKVPVFVTNPWGYTKPANSLEVLDNWADTIPGLKDHPRLNVPFNPEWSRVCHSRIISWCFFGRTDWSREVACYAPNRLPVPSQDTYLWYCAARRGDFYRTVKMKQHGWDHVSNRRKLVDQCRAIMNGA
jgi:hypothetical protein